MANITPDTTPSTAPDITPAMQIEALGDKTRRFLVAGLKDAHAMENQALAIMKPQLERIEAYPEVADMLRLHIRETEEQESRIERILDMIGEDRSTLKDTALRIGGAMAAMGHMPAPDEIVKNSFANHAFEHYEMAAYTSLIAVCEDAGLLDICAEMKKSLAEEEAMADWLADNIGPLTLKYLDRKQAGLQAKH
jgi:ferritin-like metal-binding protein YciE